MLWLAIFCGSLLATVLLVSGFLYVLLGNPLGPEWPLAKHWLRLAKFHYYGWRLASAERRLRRNPRDEKAGLVRGMCLVKRGALEVWIRDYRGEEGYW